MRRFPTISSTGRLLTVGFLAVAGGTVRAGDTNWPSFRGPSASGIAEGHPLPSRWDVPKNENVRWKTAIPGLGLSSPVIWGDRVFITTAVGERDDKLKVGLYGDIQPIKDDSPLSWRVICLNRKTGAIEWDAEAHKGVPKVKRHPKSSHANSTAATDGRHVVALFGSEGLHCFDVDGKLLWKKDLGLLDAGFYAVPDAQWGFGSSPIIHDGRVIVQCDVQKDSFLAAFDVNDGREIWRTPRAEVPGWGTPTVYRSGDRTLLAVNGWKHIGGYDFADGSPVWKLIGGGDIPVPTPVVSHDLIFITNAHGLMAPIYAVRTSAKGDLPTPGGPTPVEQLAWFEPSSGNYMQTPLVVGDWLYMCRDNGALACYEAATGKRLWRERLGDGGTGFTASGVAGDGKLFFTSEEGDVHVVKAAAEFQRIGINPLGEFCMASPAISEGMLFFRTQGHVVAVGEASSK